MPLKVSFYLVAAPLLLLLLASSWLLLLVLVFKYTLTWAKIILDTCSSQPVQRQSQFSVLLLRKAAYTNQSLRKKGQRPLRVIISLMSLS